MMFSQKFRDVFSFDFPRTFDGFHHFHLRKRKAITFEEKSKRFIDKSIYVVSVLFPLMTLPQIWEIYETGQVSGVSLSMWIWSTVFSLYWGAYGLVHKDKPIIITQVLWTMINMLVITGILIYS